MLTRILYDDPRAEIILYSLYIECWFVHVVAIVLFLRHVLSHFPQDIVPIDAFWQEQKEFNRRIRGEGLRQHTQPHTYRMPKY